MVITVLNRPATVVTVFTLCHYSVYCVTYYTSGAVACVAAMYSVRSG